MVCNGLQWHLWARIRGIGPGGFPDRRPHTPSMELIAHRGFAEAGLENALPTLVAAEARADAVEFDLRLAADGVPVVFHDERVDRLTAASGPVGDFDAAELAALQLADTDATVPTLEAVLDALSGRVVPDLKVDRVPDGLADALVAYDGRVLASSFRPGTLRDLPSSLDRAILASPPAEDSEWTFPAGMPTSMAAAIDVARDLGAAAIHPHTSLCEADAVERAQSAGFALNAWTVRSRQTAAAMRAAGVDGIIADHPDYARP